MSKNMVKLLLWFRKRWHKLALSFLLAFFLEYIVVCFLSSSDATSPLKNLELLIVAIPDPIYLLLSVLPLMNDFLRSQYPLLPFVAIFTLPYSLAFWILSYIVYRLLYVILSKNKKNNSGKEKI